MEIFAKCLILVSLTGLLVGADQSDDFQSFRSQSSKSVSIGRGPAISTSQSSVTVEQQCTNGDCQTCINGKCFKNFNFTSVKSVGGCPITACTKSCNQLVQFTDGCPLCSCNDGHGVREPCNGDSDCPKNATGCTENVCVYSNIPNDLPRACTYAYECPSTEDCNNNTCVASTAGKHIEGQFCTFESNCPSKYTCRRSTCWEGGQAHLENRFCVFDYQCPSGYQCRQQTCYKGGPEHGETSCVFDSQCDNGMKCVRMTCIRQ